MMKGNEIGDAGARSVSGLLECSSSLTWLNVGVHLRRSAESIVSPRAPLIDCSSSKWALLVRKRSQTAYRLAPASLGSSWLCVLLTFLPRNGWGIPQLHAAYSPHASVTILETRAFMPSPRRSTAPLAWNTCHWSYVWASSGECHSGGMVLTGDTRTTTLVRRARPPWREQSNARSR